MTRSERLLAVAIGFGVLALLTTTTGRLSLAVGAQTRPTATGTARPTAVTGHRPAPSARPGAASSAGRRTGTARTPSATTGSVRGGVSGGAAWTTGSSTGIPTATWAAAPTGSPGPAAPTTGTGSGPLVPNASGSPSGGGPDPTGPAGPTTPTDPGAGQPIGPGGDCPTPVGILRQAPGSGRTVALTFDDGPGPATDRVLAVLRDAGVHATFFVIGNQVAADPSAVTAAAEQGNLVGNHTWDHLYPREVRHGWSLPYLQDQLTRTEAAVTAATGLPTCFFRPPGGFLPSTVPVIGRRLHEQVTMWSVDPQDWAVQGHGTAGAGSTARMAGRIYAGAIAGVGQPHPIVLLHDGGGYRGATVAALPRIIAYYRAHGYRFVRLDGLS